MDARIHNHSLFQCFSLFLSKRFVTLQKAYDMPSLTPADWNDLINRMESDSTNVLLQKYRTYFGRHPANSCDSVCKSNIICALRSAMTSCFIKKRFLPNETLADNTALCNGALKKEKAPELNTALYVDALRSAQRTRKSVKGVCSSGGV